MSKAVNRPEKPTILNTLSYIYKENGIKGLYRGVTPRIGLGIWQTVCMVSFADYVKAWYVGFPSDNTQFRAKSFCSTGYRSRIKKATLIVVRIHRAVRRACSWIIPTGCRPRYIAHLHSLHIIFFWGEDPFYFQFLRLVSERGVCHCVGVTNSSR